NNGKDSRKVSFEDLKHSTDGITNSSDTDSGFGSDNGSTKRQPRDYSSASMHIRDRDTNKESSTVLRQKSFTANLDLGVSNGLADINVKQLMTTLPIAIGHPTINDENVWNKDAKKRKIKFNTRNIRKNIVIGGVKSVYQGLDSLTLSNLVMSIINPPGQLTIHSLAALVLRAFLVLQMRNNCQY